MEGIYKSQTCCEAGTESQRVSGGDSLVAIDKLNIATLGGSEMKQKFLVGLLAGLIAIGTIGLAQATIFDASISPDVIFGSGNANGFFVVDSADNVEVGLRAKVPYQGIYNYDGVSTYSFDTGAHPKWGDPGASWNFEFSVNVDVKNLTGDTLDDYDILLSIDMDPGLDQNWTSFNPFTTFVDNALGFYNTANGGGDDSAAANDAYYKYSVGQNSMNIGWLGLPFDNSVPGTYDFLLSISDGSNKIVETFMKVEVGGGAPVPEPATMVLFGLGILGLAGVSRKKQK
jgi:hypothetical protein